MGSKDSKTTVKTPFKKQAKRLAGRAEDASLAAEGVGPFEGEFIADPTQQQLDATAQREALASFLQTGNIEGLPAFAQPIFQLAMDQAQGKFLSPESNPFLASTIDAATDPIQRQLEQTLRQTRSQAVAQGAFGGNREAILSSELFRNAAEEEGNIASKIAFDNLTRERALQQGSAGLLAQGTQLALDPSQLLFQAGEVGRQFSQDEIQDAILQQQEQIDALFRPLIPEAQILALIQGAGGTQTTQSGGGGGVAGGVQGGLGGAASGAGIGQILGGGNNSVIGAILGGLLGGAGGILG